MNTLNSVYMTKQAASVERQQHRPDDLTMRPQAQQRSRDIKPTKSRGMKLNNPIIAHSVDDSYPTSPNLWKKFTEHFLSQIAQLVKLSGTKLWDSYF